MHKYLNEYPQADKYRFEDAKKLFPYNDISAEEYAAREAHTWWCFSFDKYIYPDEKLNEWIHSLGDIFYTPRKVQELRLKYLTPEEIKNIEDYENNP